MKFRQNDDKIYLKKLVEYDCKIIYFPSRRALGRAYYKDGFIGNFFRRPIDYLNNEDFVKITKDEAEEFLGYKIAPLKNEI
jgi:hypothetical protein